MRRNKSNGALASYKFCSLCGGNLQKKGGNLSCAKCSFVNYRNPRPTATGLIFHKGRILLTKRAREPFKGWWDLPGGFLHQGEHPEEALKREILEETGLKIKIKKLFGLYTGTHPSDSEPFWIITAAYVAESSTESLKAIDDVAESRWFSKKELPEKIAFDSNQLLIKDFLKTWK